MDQPYANLAFLPEFSSPVRPGLAPKLPAVGEAASVKKVPEASVVVPKVRVLVPHQKLVGCQVGSYAEALSGDQEDIPNQQWHL